jgi:hypothetical protein
LPLPSRRRAQPFWLPRSHGPDHTLRPDQFPINVQPIYPPLRRIMWTTSVFFCAQDVNGLSQVKVPRWTCTAATIPSISLPVHRHAALWHKSSTHACTGRCQQGHCAAPGPGLSPLGVPDSSSAISEESRGIRVTAPPRARDDSGTYGWKAQPADVLLGWPRHDSVLAR